LEKKVGVKELDEFNDLVVVKGEEVERVFLFSALYYRYLYGYVFGNLLD